MGQHYFLDNSTIQECVSHDQRKLQLVKKTCEENVESAIDVFLEEASSVNSWQKHYQRHHRRHYLINYHCQFGSKTSSLSKKKLKRPQSQQQQQNNIDKKTRTVSHQ